MAAIHGRERQRDAGGAEDCRNDRQRGYITSCGAVAASTAAAAMKAPRRSSRQLGILALVVIACGLAVLLSALSLHPLEAEAAATSGVSATEEKDSDRSKFPAEIKKSKVKIKWTKRDMVKVGALVVCLIAAFWLFVHGLASSRIGKFLVDAEARDRLHETEMMAEARREAQAHLQASAPPPYSEVVEEPSTSKSPESSREPRESSPDIQPELFVPETDMGDAGYARMWKGFVLGQIGFSLFLVIIFKLVQLCKSLKQRAWMKAKFAAFNEARHADLSEIRERLDSQLKKVKLEVKLLQLLVQSKKPTSGSPPQMSADTGGAFGADDAATPPIFTTLPTPPHDTEEAWDDDDANAPITPPTGTLF